MFEQAMPVLAEFLSWPSPLFLLLGVLAGLVFGVLPGLGGPQVLALLLPLTFTMNSTDAIILLIGAAGAVPLGGSMTAILINTPGTPQNAATTYDGYPMTRMGKAGQAIGAAASASVFGAVIGAVILTAILPLGRHAVLAFSYPETFMMALMGLAIIALLAKGNMWKALIAAGLGLMLSTVGLDIATGTMRYTLGTYYLIDGIKLIPALIGLFAVAEAVSLLTQKASITTAKTSSSMKGVLEGVMAPFRHFGIFLRSSLIGTLIGIVPGVGGAVANFLGYAQAISTSKDKSQFGKGDIRGVIGAEAANNAKDGGALVPTLIFGIPGSLEFAVLLGALMIHGIQPGPRLMLDSPQIALVMIYALVMANIVVGVVGVLSANFLASISTVRISLVAPAVLMFALVGSYATEGHIGDVYTTIIFGLLGYVMIRYDYSRVALVIALVLGPILQQSLHQTMSAQGLVGFVNRPISLTFLLITLFILILPFVRGRGQRADTSTA
jgi:putative tricarboxylic transport membrane protein